ncbi:hypothetical protein ABZ845_04940 [Streptomyces sp. NPDC047022]|uniref:hypothetical protein n=1 Tax=Streptomyces sp. NPDC047022 TaxID=3155737 RepID=UPI003405CC13
MAGSVGSPLSVGVAVAGADADDEAEADDEADAEADADAEAEAEADADCDAPESALSDAEPLGDGLPVLWAGDPVGDSSANAAGAERSAIGAMAAVAAAAAKARRSFMKTSGSPMRRESTAHAWEASACGARVWPLIQSVR